MNNINEELCKCMHDFVLEHLDEIAYPYKNLGFKDSQDMLEQIKSNVTKATWAISELVIHFMKNSYRNKFYYDERDDCIFNFKDSEENIRYFTLQDEYPVEMKLIQILKVETKFVPVLKRLNIGGEDKKQILNGILRFKQLYYLLA